MHVPFLNISRSMSFHTCSADIEKIFSSGRYLFGEFSKNLENKLSHIFDAEVVTVGSGTDALALSLMSLGVGRNDRVIVPAYSAIPTAVAVKMTGAEPLYVDVDLKTGCMEPNLLSQALDKYHDIKAVIVVHLYGNVADMSMIRGLCRGRNIPVIEDCAQSYGSMSLAQLTGLHGTMGAFSFYPTKNLGCLGDGGAVITKNSRLAEKVRELRFYGQKSSYVMGDQHGLNSRMDEIQCAVLLKKLENVDVEFSKRKKMKLKYDKALSGFEYIKTLEWDFGAIPHLYPIFVSNRKSFQAKMLERGVVTAIHYPFTLPAAVSKIYEPFSNAEYLSERAVSLPFNPWMTESEINHVLDVTISVIEGD